LLDVIVTYTAPSTRAVEEQTQTIPIALGDNFGPVPGALVENIARPEGNMTAADNFYDSMRSKWPELLKDVASLVEGVARR
jgi:ABC-type uncharacterized transport system substrate-binding protein